MPYVHGVPLRSSNPSVPRQQPPLRAHSDSSLPSGLLLQMGAAYGTSHGGTPGMPPLPYSGAMMGPSPTLPAAYGRMSPYMTGGPSDGGGPTAFPAALQVTAHVSRHLIAHASPSPYG